MPCRQVLNAVDGNVSHLSFERFIDEFLKFFRTPGFVAGPATEGDACSRTFYLKGFSALRAAAVGVGFVEHFISFL